MPDSFPSSTSDATPIVRMRGIVKSFGTVQANRGAELEVARGDIHALVGEKGAGKSTLVRVLAGMYAPNAGTVEVDGRDVTGWTTADAIAAGVGMVHQHFMLVPTLTVAENVTLGAEPRRGLVLDRDGAVRETRRLSAESGLDVPATARVAELSVGQAQRVEILKALYRGARLLVLDEPTAVLSPPEVSELWRVLERLRDGGATVVLITHKLDEIVDISDSITVMRAGRTVTRMATRDASPQAIARAMVGREVVLATDAASVAERRSPAMDAAHALLSVRDLTVERAPGLVAVRGVSFEVAAGEVFGVAGVEGNGQRELIEAIAGLRPAASGSIALAGRDLRALDVRQHGDAGVSHIPEDRHERALVLDHSVAENLILGQQHRFTRGPMLDARRIDAHARELMARYDIRPSDPALAVRALSGGNQQKVVVARELAREFRVLLAAQPTRGVDVGAVEFIHTRLRETRDEGKAVLLVSADLAELLALSDRIAVMYGGCFVATLRRGEASAATLGEYMTGAEHAA
jgi:simple sugar transport system ATP-binding protein